MATMTEYLDGVPSWVDLMTPDPTASRAFYAALFGWDYDDQPTDRPGTDYTMAMKGGRAAAGMMQLSPEMAAGGMPPVWTTYVTVSDIDATTGRVEAAGGTLLQPPMDVMEAGRMAVLADPAGAVICAWQARDHIGCEVVNEHGALTWNELVTPDPAAVSDFYAQVFGWAAETAPMPGGEYTVFRVEGANANGIAGATAPPMPGMQSFWSVYFHVDDVAGAVDTARGLRAQIMMEATAVPGVGTLATLVDPQGAVVSLMSPEV